MDTRKDSTATQIDKLQRELLSIPSKALQDREIVDRGLIFAKECPTQTEILHAMFYFGYLGIAQQLSLPNSGPDWQAQFIRLMERTPSLREQMNLYWRNLEKDRKDFRQKLIAVNDNAKKAAKEMGSALDKIREDMLIVTRPVRDQHGLRLEHRYYPQSIRASYGYVLDLLLFRGFAKDLRRCRLKLCQAFFLSAPALKGGRRPVYCSTECQVASKKLQDAERQAKHRYRKKLNQTGKRKVQSRRTRQ